MFSMKMSEGGRVVIPVEIRQAMGLKEGDTVLWDYADGTAHLTTRSQRIKQAQTVLRQYVPAGVSLVDELIAERRVEGRAEGLV
jgi:AbrB family looped-hinge helix DNA binding protein